eukprot:SAG31_NODE_1432_length_8373_cov_8.838289_3_plen_81_part_00
MSACRIIASTLAVLQLAAVLLLWLAAFDFSAAALVQADVLRFSFSRSISDVAITALLCALATGEGCYFLVFVGLFSFSWD